MPRSPPAEIVGAHKLAYFKKIHAVDNLPDVHRVQVYRRLVAVIALVGDDLFQRRRNEHRPI